MKRVNKSLWLPAAMLIYLAVIAIVYGLPHLRAGEHLLFYGVTGGSLLVIVLLHIVLRKKERQASSRPPEDTYGPYPTASPNPTVKTPKDNDVKTRDM